MREAPSRHRLGRVPRTEILWKLGRRDTQLSHREAATGPGG